MKIAHLFLLIFILSPFTLLFATNYYSGGSLNVNLTTSWWTNRNNSGSHPSNFTADNQVFYVEGYDVMIASAKWTVSGSNSYVIIENNGKIITGLFDHQITGRVNNGGTYEVTNDTYSNLGWGGNGYLEDTSNFVLNHNPITFKDQVSYGNLIVKQGIADCTGSTAGFEVRGTLQLDGGTFEGGQTTDDQTLSIANIYVHNGTFIGSDGGANDTFNMSGSITMDGGIFYGSNGGGYCTYNIGGDLLISGGQFYGTYRDNYTLPYNTYNIGGSFVHSAGFFYSVNVINGGYPTYYLTGVGKNFGIGDLTYDAQAHHNIDIGSGASYTLVDNVSMGSSMQFHERGILDAGTYQLKGVGSSALFNFYGTLKTANTSGFSGTSSTTVSSTNSPSIVLWSGCTIEYNSASAQVVTARTDYSNMTISSTGTKSISGATTVGSTFALNGPLSIGSNTLTLNGAVSGSGTLTGGVSSNITYGGSGASTGLPSVSLNNLTVSRTSGITLSGAVTVTGTLSLTGNMGINGHTFTMSGTKSGAGLIVGSSSSNMIISGSGLNFSIETITLNQLTLNRSNGATMGADITTVDLILTSGAFTVGSHRLTLNGALSFGSGSLNAGSSSDITVGGTAANFAIPASLSIHNLTLNRPLGATMGGVLSLTSLDLLSGSLTISSNTLTITDYINTTSGSLTGGTSSNIIIGGTISTPQTTLPSVVLNNLNVLRANGIAISGTVSINGTLALTSGGLSIGSSTLLMNGTKTGSSLMTGTTSSSLTIGGAVSTFSLEAITLGNLSLSRASGCTMIGNVSVNNLNLISGHFTVGANQLTINMIMSEFLGTLITDSSSSLLIGGNGLNFNLRGLTVGTLGISRMNGCTLTGDVITTNLNLNRGALLLSSHRLTVGGIITQFMGSLTGGADAKLTINGTALAATVPSVTLQELVLDRPSGMLMGGSLTVEDLYLTAGSLNLNNNSLSITGDLTMGTGSFTGSQTSSLTISGAGTGLELSGVTLGYFTLDRADGATLTDYVYIYSAFYLLKGELTNSQYLVFIDNTTINRGLGALDVEPVWQGTVNLFYQSTVVTGNEIPSSSGILNSIIISPSILVTLNSNAYVESSVTLLINSQLNTASSSLVLKPTAILNTNQNTEIFGTVSQEIGIKGFNNDAVGVHVANGLEITGFQATHLDQAVDVFGKSGIHRKWTINGSFTGTSQLTLVWPSTADNGHVFSPENKAIVYRYNGTSWQPVGTPVDVSLLNPRMIQVNTNEFSEWTVGAENETLPVELTSFTAITTQQNYVQLNWITQSETNLVGYRILRSTENTLQTAEDMNIMVAALNTSTQQTYQFVDEEIEAPVLLYYWLQYVNTDGTSGFHGPVSIFVEQNDNPDVPPIIPELTRLESIFPNPFIGDTTIRYSLKTPNQVEISIYNVKGQLMASFHKNNDKAGIYQTTWSGINLIGKACPSGVYFVKMKAGECVEVRKILLLK